MDGSPLAVRKLIVGILAIICLTTAAGMWIFAGDPWTNPITSVAMRMGMMLGALWLALPARGENIAWEKGLPIVIAVVVVLAFAKNAKVLLYAVPAAIVLGILAVFLRPRSKRRPPGR